MHSIGLEIRAGLHTGETELTGEKAAGIAVTTAARVSALAGPGEVLVTRTLAELVAGSGFRFSDRGEHELKGVPGEWRLLALSGIDGEPLAPNLDPEEALERRAHVAPVRHGRSRRRTLVLVSAVAVIALVAATLPFVLHHAQAPLWPPTASNCSMPHRVGAWEVWRLPRLRRGSASGAMYVWVSDPQDGTVLKVDPSIRRVVDTISVGSGSDPAGIAFGDGAVWVALSGDGKLARIDPSTDTPVNVSVGDGPTGVATSSGSVWVTNYIDDTVMRVSATTNHVVSTVKVGSGPVAVAANAARSMGRQLGRRERHPDPGRAGNHGDRCRQRAFGHRDRGHRGVGVEQLGQHAVADRRRH